MIRAISPSEAFKDVLRNVSDRSAPRPTGLDVLVNHVNRYIKEHEDQHAIYKSILIPVDDLYLWCDDFKLYGDNENWNKLCDVFEEKGWSCRYGRQINWKNYLGQLVYFFEVSAWLYFTYRDVCLYKQELAQGEN